MRAEEWREILGPARQRTLPEMVLTALDAAALDAEIIEDWDIIRPSNRATLAEAVGYDVYDALRGILDAILPDHDNTTDLGGNS